MANNNFRFNVYIVLRTNIKQNERSQKSRNTTVKWQLSHFDVKWRMSFYQSLVTQRVVEWHDESEIVLCKNCVLFLVTVYIAHCHADRKAR